MKQDIDELIALSMQISKLIAHDSDSSFEERAATILQFHALSYLEKEPDASLSMIADHLRSSRSSTAQLVDRLYKSGFVTREGDEEDRRVVHISLTDEGREKLQQMKEAKRAKMKKIFSMMEKEDMKELIRIQKKLLRNLQANPNI